MFKINTIGKPKISYSVRVCAVGIKVKMSSRLFLPHSLSKSVECREEGDKVLSGKEQGHKEESPELNSVCTCVGEDTQREEIPGNCLKLIWQE